MTIMITMTQTAQQNGISTRQATFRIGEQVNDGGQTTIGGATWSR